VFRFGHHLLVPTKSARAGQTVSVDTGALTNAISPQAAREVTKVGNSDTLVTGVSGSVKNVYSATKPYFIWWLASRKSDICL